MVTEDPSGGECVWEGSEVREEGGDVAASKGQFRIAILINKTDFLLGDGESRA